MASHTERKPLKTTPSGRRLRAGAAAISMLSLNMSNLNRGSAHSRGEQEGHAVLASHDVCSGPRVSVPHGARDRPLEASGFQVRPWAWRIIIFELVRLFCVR